MNREQLEVAPYRRLMRVIKGKGELYKQAAEEIHVRRRDKDLPQIYSYKDYSLTDNQQKILEILLTDLTGMPDKYETDNIKVVSVSYKVKGGWTVYATGSDFEIIRKKSLLIKEMVHSDANEFDLCRVCFSAVRDQINNWDGLLIRFDRGLRLVYE